MEMSIHSTCVLFRNETPSFINYSENVKFLNGDAFEFTFDAIKQRLQSINVHTTLISCVRTSLTNQS